MTKYFGAGSTLVGDATGLTLTIPSAILAEKGLLGSPEGASEDKLAIALVNCLYESTKAVSSNPSFLIVGESIFPSRGSVGEGDSAQLFNTYSFTIQVRVPAGDVSTLPDPDF